MTKTELAYIAGIIDGEGTITLSRHHGNQMPSPSISVANNDLRLLQWLKKIVGGGVIIQKKKRKEHHGNSYAWNLRSNAALALMNSLLPWLLIKSSRAKLILRDYKRLTPRNGRYTKEQHEQKMTLAKRVHSMNAR